MGYQDVDQHAMPKTRPRLRQPVIDTLDQIRKENEYGSYDEAITHALREAGYNV